MAVSGTASGGKPGAGTGVGTGVSGPRGVLPSGRVFGRVEVPGSKSVAQRIFNLTLLAGSPITITSPPNDQDSLAFLSVLNGLEWTVEENETQDWMLTPPRRYPEQASLDCGSSGTGFRFLVASLTTLPGRWTVHGSAQLGARPIQELIDSLSRVGCRIRPASASSSLPIEIEGGPWQESGLQVDARTSSQYLSALLMAATCASTRASTRASTPTTIRVDNLVSEPYVDLTVAWMRLFGARLEHTDGDSSQREYLVRPGLDAPQQAAIEADWSSAAYPAAAAALTGGTVELVGVERASSQGDLGFLELLQRMGAKIEWTEGGVKVRGFGALQALDVDLGNMPDQVPTLACLAPFASGTTVIRGAAHLRHKESDRLQVLTRELTQVGAQVEQREDGLRIEGSWSRGEVPQFEVAVDPQEDHRIAMAMAVLAAKRPGIRMRQPEVVAKSYREFWQHWQSLFS